MKNYKLLSLIALTAAFSCSPNNEDGQSGNTPVEKYGALKVSGIQLCAQNGKALQLRGMSTHGLQWFGKCQTEEAYRSLAEEWLHEYDFLKNQLDCGDSNRYMDHLCRSNGLAVYQYLPGR